MKRLDFNRRDFLKLLGIGSFAATAPAIMSHCGEDKKFREEGPYDKPTEDFEPDLDVKLTATFKNKDILSGGSTEVMTYEAEVISGDASKILDSGDTYLGPTFNVKRGDKLRVHFVNDIDQESIIHWHGLHVSHDNDGHPQYVIQPGETYVYEFSVLNRAGTYWYHPHPHGITGPQVLAGLAGLFIISDDEEQNLTLPRDDYDVPLVLQDRDFSSDNQLNYINTPMDRMIGFLGDTILVNGKPDFSAEVSGSCYRFRILNGSNSRIYKLAWSDDEPIYVIGTDGGLLDKPLEKDYVVLGPAERIDVWRDFSDKEPGSTVKLVNREYKYPGTHMGMSMNGSGGNGMMGRNGGMMGRNGGMMGRNGGMMEDNPMQSSAYTELPQGSAYDIAEFVVNDKSAKVLSMPEKLTTLKPFKSSDAVNAKDPRQFFFGMGNHMQWTINGRVFDMTGVADEEKVKLGDTEVWEFINATQRRRMRMGDMMEIPHPIHIHGLSFNIISRETPFEETIYDDLEDGFVDAGWKDSFLLLPDEKVKVLLRFEDYAGLFLYHCHNLEHEDMGMMRNYLIE